MKDKVEIINANNPHGNGLLLPESFVPFPKNPLIARFFIQPGRVDELGSGILNVYRYLKDYSQGREPQFIEDKLFKTIIPVGNIDDDAINDAINGTNDAINLQVQKRLVEELKLIHKKSGLTLNVITEVYHVKRATAQRDMKMLKDIGYVDFTGSNKSGKYVLTEKGSQLFNQIKQP